MEASAAITEQDGYGVVSGTTERLWELLNRFLGRRSKGSIERWNLICLRFASLNLRIAK
jgi:hypothetical protein